MHIIAMENFQSPFPRAHIGASWQVIFQLLLIFRMNVSKYEGNIVDLHRTSVNMTNTNGKLSDL